MHRRTTAVALDRFLAGESVPARWWLLGGFFTRWTEGCVGWKRWDRMHLGHPARPIAQQFRGPRRTDQFGCHFARRQLFRLARRQWGSQTLDRGEPPSGRFNALTVELAGPHPFQRGEFILITGATAIAPGSNGAITAITVTNSGNGYTPPPNISCPIAQDPRWPTH